MAAITGDKYIELQQRYKAEKTRTQNLEEARQSLKKQLAQTMTQSAANFAGLEIQYDKLQKKHDKLQTNCTKEHELNKSLQNQIDDDAETIRGLQESYAKEKQHREDLQKQLEETQVSKGIPEPTEITKMASILVDNRNKSKKIARIENKEKEYRESLQGMCTISHALRDQLEEQKQKFADYQAEQCNEQRRKATRTNHKMERKMKTLQRDHDKLLTKYNKLEAAHKKQSKQLEDYMVRCEEIEALIQRLEREQREDETQIEELKQERAAWKRECNKLKQMHCKQKQRAEKAECMRHKLGENVNKLLRESKIKKKHIHLLTKEVAERRIQLQSEREKLRAERVKSKQFEGNVEGLSLVSLLQC